LGIALLALTAKPIHATPRHMFIPVLAESMRRYRTATFLRDLSAGLTVGFVALPVCLAFAIASGLPPEHGLYTGIVAGFLISALGGSAVQIGGNSGSFIVIVSLVVARHGYDGLVVATMLAGLFLIILGVARFGAILKFIPSPVVTGFTTGMAVLIFSTQVKDLLGLQMDTVPPGFVAKWIDYFRHAGTWQPWTAGLGLATTAIIFGLRKLVPRWPNMILVMAAMTAAAYAFDLPVATIGSRFGDLPSGLPPFRLPVIDPASISELISPAMTIALLCAIESLLSATVADGMLGTRHKSNMELVAQGFANVGSMLFGGMPAAGAMARTATNINAGAQTPIAGIIHSLTLLAILLIFAPLAKLIPLCVLAGLLVVVAWQMSELEHFRQLLRAPRADVAVLLMTFSLTLLVDLDVAVEVGVVVSSLLFIRRMSEIANVGMVTDELLDKEVSEDPTSHVHREIPRGVVIYEINGPFFFGAASKFKDTLAQLRKPPKVLILRVRHVPVIDGTGLMVLDELHRRSRKNGTFLVLSDIHTQPLIALERSHLWEQLGTENIVGSLDDALNRAHEILGMSPYVSGEFRAISGEFQAIPTVRG